MTVRWRRAIPIGLAMAAMAAMTLSCAPEETPEVKSLEVAPPPAVVETGPDPTVVDPGHYQAEFENDRVRIVRITYGPGEESVMHYHPDHAGVCLTDLHVSFMMPDGTSQEMHALAGQHIFAPGGQHLPKNIGEGQLELIAVELKSMEPAAASAESEVGSDPTVADTDHYQTEFENDRVRAVRITYGPGEESVMHHHPDSVAVFLNAQHWGMTKPDGTSEETHFEAGQHLFLPAGEHLPKNIGAEAAELVLIELKGS